MRFMQNLRPNALIYGARYDTMMEALRRKRLVRRWSTS
jgi:predicted GIY-YIG superfamily endonuclease